MPRERCFNPQKKKIKSPKLQICPSCIYPKPRSLSPLPQTCRASPSFPSPSLTLAQPTPRHTTSPATTLALAAPHTSHSHQFFSSHHPHILTQTTTSHHSPPPYHHNSHSTGRQTAGVHHHRRRRNQGGDPLRFSGVTSSPRARLGDFLQTARAAVIPRAHFSPLPTISSSSVNAFR